MVWKTKGNKKEKNFPNLEVMEKGWEEMHRALIVRAFAKAELELLSQNIHSPTKTKMARHLQDYLLTTHNYPYSYKSLVTLYNLAQLDERVIIKKPEVINLLSKYLDYEDFAIFSARIKQQGILDVEKVDDDDSLDNQQPENVDSPATTDFFHINKVYILIAVFVLLGLVVIFKFKNNDAGQRWLRWNKDHYEEVTFNKIYFKNGELKLYTPDLEAFKKIQVTPNTQFFDSNGVPIIWYYKHASGTVEFFNAYGLHPTKNRYVKPVTAYIINKYVE